MPFRSVNNKQWQKLCLLQNPRFPLPSPTIIRIKLDQQLKEVEQKMLSRAVPGSKIALSLDGWSSTNKHSFLGVIAHYITAEWELVEEMIGFESLTDCYSGAALAVVVNGILEKYNLLDRVLLITTDNVYNNGTLIKELNSYINEAIEKRFLNGNITRIPCLAHVIQLALKALLGKIRLAPKNETLVAVWKADQELDELEKIKAAEQRGMPFVLAKVYCQLIIYTNLYTNLYS
jgi:hypothetical protein